MKFSIILPILVLLSSANFTEADPLYHICSNTTFVSNSTYKTNLDRLLSSLSSNSTNSTQYYLIGFRNSSSGLDPDDVYCLFLCRGNRSTEVCRGCVRQAVQDIVQLCPVEKVALVWYDDCLLRYSNESFFSKMDDSPPVYMSNLGNFVGETLRFNSQTQTTLGELATEAAAKPSGAKKFAVKGVNFSASLNVYTLMQCTPDLSTFDCDRCLRTAISRYPTCCDGRPGGRVLFPSCNFWYETYPFYDDTLAVAPSLPPVVPPSPPPGTRGKGKGGISTATIVAIVAPISVSIVLFCVGCFFLRRRAQKKYNPVPEDNVVNEITTVESLQYDFATIKAATNNFSSDNKLGEGGFGEVYKGTLPNRQEVAVKRLSRHSGQGAEEFKNEVFCFDGEERILIYEYVPNKSFDYFLFGLNILNIGYMSPEYAKYGKFSVKSDAYSFGVLLLEIICGKKNSSFYQTDGATNLVSHVWRRWRDGTPLEVLDPTLADKYPRNEVIRCIHVGLLCVQEDPADRPTMANVVLMLDSYSVSLQFPQ